MQAPGGAFAGEPGKLARPGRRVVERGRGWRTSGLSASRVRCSSCQAHAEQFANLDLVLGVWAVGAVETGLTSPLGLLASPHPGRAASITEKPQEPASPATPKVPSFAQHFLLV